MANVRDHVISIPAGEFRDVKHNVSTFVFVKETNATIPVLRIDQGQRFVNVKQGHRVTTPESFASTQIENTGTVDLEVILTTGVGGYSTNEVAGSVLIEGGTIDNITNPVQITGGDPVLDCVPVANCEDAAGMAVPLQVIDMGSSGGNTSFDLVAVTQVSNLFEIAANPDRIRLFITVEITSRMWAQVRQGAAQAGGAGIAVQPGETFELESNSAMQVRNPATVANQPLQIAVYELVRV